MEKAIATMKFINGSNLLKTKEMSEMTEQLSYPNLEVDYGLLQGAFFSRSWICYGFAWAIALGFWRPFL